MTDVQHIKSRLQALRGSPVADADSNSPSLLARRYEAPTGVVEPMSLSAMLDRIEMMIEADPALGGIVVNRLSKLLAGAPAPVVLNGFPLDPGTVEASIWDNQPNGKPVKLDGDKSRERPARYAVSIRAFKRGHKTPITSKVADFSANVGDLFTADQIRHRIKAIWKGLEVEEAKFITDHILPLAEGNGLLVARLCLKRSAKAGGGTHWHPYHYAMVNEAELASRAVTGIALYAGKDRPLIMLPPCVTTSGKGDPFEVVTKTTRSGKARSSLVIAQSRATDLTSSKMEAWKTGSLS